MHQHWSISIHVPTWGTTKLKFYFQIFVEFQSTFPRGERRLGYTGYVVLNKFQSTFPRGERPAQLVQHIVGLYFNPRSHVGNDDLVLHKLIYSQIFQSTFPRGERPISSFDNSCKHQFQSTFPRGERHLSQAHILHDHNFNPRSHVGNDISCQLHINNMVISIHVPTWGTTANFHKYSLLFYAINIIFLLFIIPSLFSLVLFILLF